MKQECQTHCYSALNHNLSYCYDAARVIRWTPGQAAPGFQGVTGSFDYDPLKARADGGR
jgi:hypothetical protein